MTDPASWPAPLLAAIGTFAPGTAAELRAVREEARRQRSVVWVRPETIARMQAVHDSSAEHLDSGS